MKIAIVQSWIQLETLPKKPSKDENQDFHMSWSAGLENWLLKSIWFSYWLFLWSNIEVTIEILAQFIKEMCALCRLIFKSGLVAFYLSKLSRGGTGIRCFLSLQVNPNLLAKWPTTWLWKCHLKGIMVKIFSPVLGLDYKYPEPVGKSYWALVGVWEEGLWVSLDSHNLLPRFRSQVFKTYTVSEEEVRRAIVSEDTTFLLSIVLRWKARSDYNRLHQRLTRWSKFVLGGGILDSNYFFILKGLQATFVQFYFSGFRPAEFRKVFGMMKGMGTPFLLFRTLVSGGAFWELKSLKIASDTINIIRTV